MAEEYYSYWTRLRQQPNNKRPRFDIIQLNTKTKEERVVLTGVLGHRLAYGIAEQLQNAYLLGEIMGKAGD